MTNNLKIRVAGKSTATEVDYPLDIVSDFSEDFECFGHLSGDTLIIADAHAKKSFIQWLAFNDTLNRLIISYTTIGLISEEEADELYESDEVHSLPMPDQDMAVYNRLMALIAER